MTENHKKDNFRYAKTKNEENKIETGELQLEKRKQKKREKDDNE